MHFSGHFERQPPQWAQLGEIKYILKSLPSGNGFKAFTVNNDAAAPSGLNKAHIAQTVKLAAYHHAGRAQMICKLLVSRFHRVGSRPVLFAGFYDISGYAAPERIEKHIRDIVDYKLRVFCGVSVNKLRHFRHIVGDLSKDVLA